MHYGNIKLNDIANGEGIRVSLFVSGCTNHCKECFNPETWNFEQGTLIDNDEIIEKLKKNPLLDGVTLSGGDPMFQAKACAVLARKVHELGMNVWAYTGFTYEELLKKGNKDILEFLFEIDVLISS